MANDDKQEIEQAKADAEEAKAQVEFALWE